MMMDAPHVHEMKIEATKRVTLKRQVAQLELTEVEENALREQFQRRSTEAEVAVCPQQPAARPKFYSGGRWLLSQQIENRTFALVACGVGTVVIGLSVGWTRRQAVARGNRVRAAVGLRGPARR